MANVDEVFAKEEKELIEDYKEELKLPKDYEMKNISYEDIMKVLSKATVRNKRIIYFEN